MNQTWHKMPPMTQEEWLAWRFQGIGGSDVPAIMGVSPWSTPFEKWEEKVFKKQSEDNASKRFGRESEAFSRSEFEQIVGFPMEACNVQQVLCPYLRASLDGLSPDGNTVLEIKKANKEDHALALEGKVPEKYYPQCQYILMVTDLPVLHYFSSPAKGGKGIVVMVERNQAYLQNELMPKVVEFWNRVVNLEPPPLSERDFLNMDEDAQWCETVSKWKEAKDTLLQVECREKELREGLIALSKGRNVRSTKASLTKCMVQGRIDYDQAFKDYVHNLKIHHPEVDFPEIHTKNYRKEGYIKYTLRAMD